MSNKERTKSRKEQTTLIKGIIDITRSGSGYLVVPGMEKDIFIKAPDLNRAMHGDTVRIRLNDRPGKRLEGKVEEIVERKQTEFIGTIEVGEGFAFFKPDTQKSVPDFYISKKALNGAVNNDTVRVKLVSWAKKEKKPGR